MVSMVLVYMLYFVLLKLALISDVSNLHQNNNNDPFVG